MIQTFWHIFYICFYEFKTFTCLDCIRPYTQFLRKIFNKSLSIIMEFIKDYVIDCDNLQVNEVQIILNDCVNHTSETDSSELSKATASNLNVSKITDNLYLCSALSAHISTLQLLGITCVVNSAIELPDTPLPEKTTLYYKINIHDSTYENIKEHFDSTSDLIYKIDASGGKILVHCTAGVSRSATLCIAYLMKHHRLSLLDAYNYVKLQRPIIRPNCGFFRQLVEYERILFGYNTVTMVHNKMLNLEIPDVYNSDYREVDCFRKKGNVRHI